MASGKDRSAASPQLTTKQHQGEITAKLKTQHSPNMDTSVREPELRALTVQAADGNSFAMNQSAELAQVGAACSSPPPGSSSQNEIRSTNVVYSSTSSDGCIQIQSPSHAVHADIGDASPSPAVCLRTSPASGSQVVSSSTRRLSLEPHYSSADSSAVSSPGVSPATPTFSRPRHSHADSTDDPLDITASENAEKLHDDGSDSFRGRNSDWDAVEHADSDESIEADDAKSRFPYGDGNDGTNMSLPVDDAEDEMEPPIDGGDDLVAPRVGVITSINSDEMDLTVETALDRVTPLSRASSPTGQIMSQLSTPSSIRDVAQPHVQFAPSTSVQDTPFVKTLKYFKQFKNKENTPSKSRRKTLLPDEIAELAKDAQQEGIEDDKALWDEYRDLDFAPLDSVMDGQNAGDLITGTPARNTVTRVEEEPKTGIDGSRMISIMPKSRAIPWGNKNDDQVSASISLEDKVIEGHANETGPMYLVDIPGHFDDAFQLRFRSRASIELIASFLRERGEALDASKDDIDRLVEEFLDSPSEFIYSESSETESLYSDPDSGVNLEDNKGAIKTGSASCGEDGGYGHNMTGHAHEKEVVSYAEDPAFVKALGMIPEAMFWVVAQPIARYSNKLLGVASKAFDTALQKLTGLSLDKPLALESSGSSNSSELSESFKSSE
ncbi:hypothetical protein PMIN03_010121 [Paraphaeosphaeria minitans]